MMRYDGKAPRAVWPKRSGAWLSPSAHYRLRPEDPKVVVLGGGSGSSAVLQGLKRHTAQITAIVTMFDSGGSSGLLREEFGFPPFGDLRQCLMALSEEFGPAATLQSLLGFRFDEDSSLHGHNLGNLMLAALTSLYDVEGAIDQLSRALRVRGRVAPVSLDPADLGAELEDGAFLRGEAVIDLRGSPRPRIARLFLDPAAKANPRAVQAILEADAVILGPGDLFTSIIPNLLVDGIPQALSRTPARLIYVCNLMTKPGETDDFTASDFLGALNCYLGDASIQWAIVNTAPVPRAIREVYARQGAFPVEADVERLARHGIKSRVGAFANGQIPLRHDPEPLAEVILSLIDSEWLPGDGLLLSEMQQVRDLREAVVGYWS